MGWHDERMDPSLCNDSAPAQQDCAEADLLPVDLRRHTVNDRGHDVRADLLHRWEHARRSIITAAIAGQMPLLKHAASADLGAMERAFTIRVPFATSREYRGWRVGHR